MDQREVIIDKVRAYRDLVKSSFPMKIEKLYLFGSYAEGFPHEHSDIERYCLKKKNIPLPIH